MMKKPVLVVMAAGMGSRYGGLKQIDPIDKEGHVKDQIYEIKYMRSNTRTHILEVTYKNK